MPQFVAAIPAFLSSAASAVGTAATGAATTLGFGSAGSLVTGILGGTATAFSALAQLRAGQQQSDSYKAQARDAALEATNEEILGQRREVGLKDQLNSTLGSISAAYAAAGIDLSYGAAETARNQAATKGDQELSLDRATTDMRKQRLYQRSNSYLMMAREARSSGVLQAAATAAGGLMKIANRG